MLKASIVRGWCPKAAGIAVALALSLGAVTIAEAQQVQTFPGSSCQASGSAQDLYYSAISGYVVANLRDTTRSAVCPIVRQNQTDGWLRIAVHVRDRHSSQDITCRVEARDVFGTPGTGWSETQSTSGEGTQVLHFGPPGAVLPINGPYTVTCSLPPMEANLPSYISSYGIVEP